MPFNYLEEMSALKSKEHQIIETARADGLEEGPATSDTEFNAAQFKIKIDCQSIVRHMISDAKVSIANYSDQLNSHRASIEAGVVMPDLETMKSSVEQEIRALLSQEGPKYVDKKVEFWTAEKNLNILRRDKGIPDTPIKAPESRKAHYITLIAYGVIETIINIFIFNTGLSGPEAFLVSSFISILNILPAVIVGNFFRYIHADNVGLKFFSLAVGLLWFLFLLWLNTSISILRSFLSSASANLISGNAPSADLFSHPYISQIFFSDAFSVFSLHAPPIRDVSSIFLWLVGILAGLLACWKGYSSDEKIPELGNRSREYDEKKEATNAIDKSLREKLSEINSKTLEVFREVKNKFDQSKRDYVSCAQILNQKVVEFERNLGNIKDEYIHLISLYRGSNKVSRRSPPPAYFHNNMPDMEILGIPDFSNFTQDKMKENIARLEDIYIEKNTSLNLLQGQFNDFLEKMNTYFESELEALDRKARESMSRPW